MFRGIISDRTGRRPTYLIGYGFQLVWALPMSLMIGTGNMWLMTFSVLVFIIPIGLSYGPQSAMYSEMFPSRTRLSGVSISYAIGAILGIMATISGIAILTIKEPCGTPLSPNQAESAEKA